MQIEINRFIRILSGIAEENKDSEIYIEVFNERGDTAPPDFNKSDFEHDTEGLVLILDHG